MKYTHKRVIFFRHLLWIIAIFCSVQLSAQNCTVNAGLDGATCFTSGFSNGYIYDIFTLNGNSAGNFNPTPNLLWELASAPVGAIITFGSPNNNTTTVRARADQLPTGTYIFRLGIDCQTGGRIYDSVSYFITNASSGFVLTADKTWSEICAGSQDSMKLVGRPLRAGEVVRINGRSISITYNNYTSYSNADFYGPTTDSVRFTIKSAISNDCTIAYWPYVRYSIKVGNCNSSTYTPLANGVSVDVGIVKASFVKTGFRTNTDTLACVTSDYYSVAPSNICVRGGRGNVSNILSTRLISGSGTCSAGYGGYSFLYYIQNKWDTVTPNTLHVYEVTYNSNGCFQAFKDTVRIFFKNVAPTSSGIIATSARYYCYDANNYPLSNLSPVLTISNPSAISPNYKFISTLNGAIGSDAIITNPNSRDTIKLTGYMVPGQYSISTVIVDTVTGCYASSATTYLSLAKKAILPILRDTTICLASDYGIVNIPYKPKVLVPGQYLFNLLSGPANNYLLQYLSLNSDSTIQFFASASTTPPGIYIVRVSPYLDVNTCNDARSDTFQITVLSGGRFSNAGTDQLLLCNSSTTNLAGSLPSASGGTGGFWKFLPTISTSTINPPVIADSTNRNTLVYGFSDLTSNYFSWNVNDGNTGSYCSLLPDTVLVVYSGIPPSSPQHAQADFFGALATNGTYMLTSNALTPTFNVQWNKISGVGGTIVNPNSQNTNVTGLTTGNYVFELVVTNTCGVFKDTVNLYFSSAGGLPVKLLSFSGNRSNETTDILFWQVVDEINMKNYEVQLSNNGFDFKTIGAVVISNSSSNNKTYDFTNNVISSSINFYRLKMVNIDGSFAYSNILKLSNKQKNINTLDVMPNPAKANLFVHINAIQAHQCTIEIVNLLGQTILKKNIQTIKGINTMLINVSNLPRGVFFLKVEDMIKKLILE
jgi:hypothetical protein